MIIMVIILMMIILMIIIAIFIAITIINNSYTNSYYYVSDLYVVIGVGSNEPTRRCVPFSRHIWLSSKIRR